MPSVVLEFSIQCIPIPKARPRLGKWGAFTPASTTAFEAVIRKAAQKAVLRNNWPVEPIDGKYELFLFVKRARNSGDIDNFAKSVMDGLNGTVWPDDKLVHQIHVGMVTDHKNPGVWIGIKRSEATTKIVYEDWKFDSGW